MKTIYTSPSGAVTVTEDGGKISVNANGTPVDTLDAEGLAKLGVAAFNHVLPANYQPTAQLIENVVFTAIDAVE